MFILNKATGRGYYGKKSMTQEEFDSIVKENRFNTHTVKIFNRDLSGLDLVTDTPTLAEITFDNCNMLGCNFSNEVLYKVNFKCCNLDGSNFYNVAFISCKIQLASFDGVNFNRCGSMESEFDKCAVKNTRITKSSIEGAYITNSSFMNTLFKDSNCGRSHLMDLRIDECVLDNFSFKSKAQYLVKNQNTTKATKVIFYTSCFDNTDMSELEYAACTMYRCKGYFANLCGIKPEDYTRLSIIHAEILGPSSVLTEEKKLCSF